MTGRTSISSSSSFSASFSSSSLNWSVYWIIIILTYFQEKENNLESQSIKLNYTLRNQKFLESKAQRLSVKKFKVHVRHILGIRTVMCMALCKLEQICLLKTKRIHRDAWKTLTEAHEVLLGPVRIYSVVQEHEIQSEVLHFINENVK